MKGKIEMKEIRAKPKSPCGKEGCINRVCANAPYCEDYKKYLKAIRQK